MFAKQHAFEYRGEPSRQQARVMAESREKTALADVMILQDISEGTVLKDKLKCDRIF